MFESSDREFYLRDLQRRSGLSLRPIQEELGHLTEIGLLRTRQDGNRLYFRANTEHPFFPEIRSLVEKTSGVQALLRSALTGPEVKVAFIFGSVAKGTAQPGSDLDLFVIGDLGLRKLTKLLSGLTDRVGKEINPHVMNGEEFRKRFQKKDHFITSVMASEKTFMVGNEDELKRLGKKRLAEDA
ncbi:MAG: nucleotidyltransferase domain-containing protein [Deltaproteobacteria bacterium]|nr:nucleotidyltransferase domain-containing protein [Deltaproteobacteria bacterium]